MVSKILFIVLVSFISQLSAQSGITVSWDANTEEDMHHYTTFIKQGVSVTEYEVSKERTFFDSPTLNPGVVTTWLTATDEAGNESEKSEELTLEIPVKQTVLKPHRPELITFNGDTLYILSNNTVNDTTLVTTEEVTLELYKIGMYEDSTAMDLTDVTFNVYIDRGIPWDENTDHTLSAVQSGSEQAIELLTGTQYKLAVQQVKGGIRSDSAWEVCYFKIAGKTPIVKEKVTIIFKF